MKADLEAETQSRNAPRPKKVTKVKKPKRRKRSAVETWQYHEFTFVGVVVIIFVVVIGAVIYAIHAEVTGKFDPALHEYDCSKVADPDRLDRLISECIDHDAPYAEENCIERAERRVCPPRGDQETKP